jgi:hypothetical protein
MLTQHVAHASEHRLADLRPLLARDPSTFAGLSPPARDALLTRAAAHGLLPAVAACLPQDDATLRARFERLAAAAHLQDARNRAVLEETLGALDRVGIVPIALKGPVLADRLHAEPGLRASTDLDLLVREADLERAIAALLPLGFQRSAPLLEAYQRRRHHHLQLHRAPGPDIELHFRAHSSFGSFPEEEPWARAVPHRTTRGTAVLTLSPEDELVYLAVHAAGHLLQRGGWILDVWLLLERHPTLDWETMAGRAAAFGCRRALAYALLAMRALGAPVPDGPHLALGEGRRRLADLLSAAFLARTGKLGTAFWVAFHLALRDRTWTVPGWVVGEAGWVVRRRAHLLARGLTRVRPRRRDLGPSGTLVSRRTRP